MNFLSFEQIAFFTQIACIRFWCAPNPNHFNRHLESPWNFNAASRIENAINHEIGCQLQIWIVSSTPFKEGGMLPKRISVNPKKCPCYRWLCSFRGMKNRSQEEVAFGKIEILSSVCWENFVKWELPNLEKSKNFSFEVWLSTKP